MGDTIELSCTEIAGASYYWVSPDGWNSTERTPVRENCLLTYSGTYTCTVTYSNGDTAEASIEVNVVPHIYCDTDDCSYCVGDDIEFYCDAITGATYYWTGPTQANPNGWHSGNRTPVRVNCQIWMGGAYTCIVTLNDVEYKASLDVVINDCN